MFKVIREDKEVDEWDIVHIESGRVVASITTGSWNGGNRKKLCVKDKQICSIKNQQEALAKLEEFFAENLRETERERENHRELLFNLGVVEGHYTYNLILKEIKVVEERINKLVQYSLK